MIKRIIISMLATVALSACQSTTEPFKLDPKIDTSTSEQSIALQIRDQRPQNHVLRLERNDKPAEFATADPTLASLISERLSQRWTLDPDASVTMRVSIKDGLVVLKQGTLRHDAAHNIRLNVIVTNAQGELEKEFRGRRETDGPLRADPARIEREFSSLLGDVLNDLVNDEAINKHIKR